MGRLLKQSFVTPSIVSNTERTFFTDIAQRCDLPLRLCVSDGESLPTSKLEMKAFSQIPAQRRPPPRRFGGVPCQAQRMSIELGIRPTAALSPRPEPEGSCNCSIPCLLILWLRLNPDRE